MDSNTDEKLLFDEFSARLNEDQKKEFMELLIEYDLAVANLGRMAAPVSRIHQRLTHQFFEGHHTIAYVYAVIDGARSTENYRLKRMSAIEAKIIPFPGASLLESPYQIKCKEDALFLLKEILAVHEAEAPPEDKHSGGFSKYYRRRLEALGQAIERGVIEPGPVCMDGHQSKE